MKTVLEKPVADPIAAMHQVMLTELAIASADQYTNPTLAEALVERLRIEEPELLERYLRARAVYLITLELGMLTRSDRSYRRANAARSAFAEAAETFEATGDDRLLLNARFVIDLKGNTKLAAQMNADDHLFVAKQKRTTAKVAAFQARFHTAVAEKLGKRITGDVFTELEYRSLYRGFAEQAKQEVA